MDIVLEHRIAQHWSPSSKTVRRSISRAQLILIGFDYDSAAVTKSLAVSGMRLDGSISFTLKDSPPTASETCSSSVLVIQSSALDAGGPNVIGPSDAPCTVTRGTSTRP